MTRMGQCYLASLKIKNFRQYVSADIEFGHKPGELFTILRGNNGTGKTNIMNAITWCLYGEEKHLDTNQSSLPTVNKESLKKTKKDKTVNMKVELGLIDEHGHGISIVRELSLYNNSAMYNDEQTTIKHDRKTGALIPLNYTPSVQKHYHWFNPNEGGWKSTEYLDGKVMELLPEGLSNYFLFDGEELEEFFDSGNKVKKGIEDVSEISIMKKASLRLNDLIKERMKRQKDPCLRHCQELVDDGKQKMKELSDEVKRLTAERNKKQNRLNKIYSRLQKSGGDISEFSRQAASVREDIKREEGMYKNRESQIKDHVLRHAVYAQAHSTIRTTLAIIKEGGKTGMLPPEISDTFLKKILDRNYCICGNDISDGSPRDLVVENLNRAQYTEISGICTRLDYMLQDINLDSAQEELRKLEVEHGEHKEKITELREKLKDLDAKLKDTSDVEIQNLVREKEALVTEITKLDGDAAVVSHEKKKAEEILNNREADHKKAIKENERQETLSKELTFCMQAQANLEAAKQELIEGVRSEVQEYTKKYFLDFLWKKGAYVDVEINEEYEIAVIDADGFGLRENLSKGEKLILALAFMTALRRITGFGFPLVIDTPLGRVSGETRYNIARTLPDFLQHEQVILLVTDSEYQAQIHDDKDEQVFPSVGEIIARHVGRDYDIVFDERLSRVEPHA